MPTHIDHLMQSVVPVLALALFPLTVIVLVGFFRLYASVAQVDMDTNKEPRDACPLKSSEFSDLTFVVGEAKFPARLSNVCTQSKVLRKALRGPFAVCPTTRSVIACKV